MIWSNYSVDSYEYDDDVTNEYDAAADIDDENVIVVVALVPPSA